jgi:DNA-binding transcriptional ArsR family regulator
MYFPPSMAKVLKVVFDTGPITPTDIEKRLSLSRRTVRYGLRSLRDRGLIRRFPNLRDTRSFLYKVDVPKMNRDQRNLLNQILILNKFL